MNLFLRESEAMTLMQQIEIEDKYKDSIIFLFQPKCNTKISFLNYIEVLIGIYDKDHLTCFNDKLVELYDINMNIDNILIGQKTYYMLEFELINTRFFTNKKKYIADISTFLSDFLKNKFDILNLKFQDNESYMDCYLESKNEMFNIKRVYITFGNNLKINKNNILDFNNKRKIYNKHNKTEIHVDRGCNGLLITIGYNRQLISLRELVIVMLINQMFFSGYSSILNKRMREEKQVCYNIDSKLNINEAKIQLHLISSEKDDIQLYNQFRKIYENNINFISDELINFHKEKLINYVLDNVSLKEKITIDLIFNQNLNLESKIVQIKELIKSFNVDDIISITNNLVIISANSIEEDD